MQFLADEDFDNRILRGVSRLVPEFDFVRVQDTALSGAADPAVLEWAASQGRIVLTHDVSTMPSHAYARQHAGHRMAGVCVIPRSLPIGKAIEELHLVVECSAAPEWENQVRFLPI